MAHAHWLIIEAVNVEPYSMESMRFLTGGGPAVYKTAINYFSPPFYFTHTLTHSHIHTHNHSLYAYTYTSRIQHTSVASKDNNRKSRKTHTHSGKMKLRNKKKCTFRTMSPFNKGILTLLLIILLCLAAGPNTANAATRAEEERAEYGSVIGIGMFLCRCVQRPG